MEKATVEQRLASLEAEVSRLRNLVAADPKIPGWKKMVGAFLNDPYFEKAMKLGRQYRESQRPKPTKKKRKRDHGSS